MKAGDGILCVDTNPKHVQAINTKGRFIDGEREEMVGKAKALLEFPEFSIRSQSIAESHRGYFVLCLARLCYLDRVN